MFFVFFIFRCSAHPAGPTELRFLDLGCGDPWYWLLGGWLVGWLVVRLVVVGCWLLFFRLSVGWLMGWWVGRWVGWWLGPETGYTQKVGIPSGRRRSISQRHGIPKRWVYQVALRSRRLGLRSENLKKPLGFLSFGEVRLLTIPTPRPFPLLLLVLCF